jgi:hypothetical protein
MVDELYAQQTWFELVRKHWPGISDDGVELVLWNATCFPFGNVEQVTAQLIEKYQQSSGNPEYAVAIAMKEMDDEMARYRAEHPRDTATDTAPV